METRFPTNPNAPLPKPKSKSEHLHRTSSDSFLPRQSHLAIRDELASRPFPSPDPALMEWCSEFDIQLLIPPVQRTPRSSFSSSEEEQKVEGGDGVQNNGAGLSRVDTAIWVPPSISGGHPKADAKGVQGPDEGKERKGSNEGLSRVQTVIYRPKPKAADAPEKDGKKDNETGLERVERAIHIEAPTPPTNSSIAGTATPTATASLAVSTSPSTSQSPTPRPGSAIGIIPPRRNQALSEPPTPIISTRLNSSSTPNPSFVPQTQNHSQIQQNWTAILPSRTRSLRTKNPTTQTDPPTPTKTPTNTPRADSGIGVVSFEEGHGEKLRDELERVRRRYQIWSAREAGKCSAAIAERERALSDP